MTMGDQAYYSFRAVDALELLGDLQRPVWRSIIDDDDFPVQRATSTAIRQLSLLEREAE